MRGWEEETHPSSFHVYLELWIPKSFGHLWKHAEHKTEPVCLLLLPSMQWELNCSIKRRTSKSWSLGIGAGLTSGRGIVRVGVERGNSLADTVSTEAKWQAVMGQNCLRKDQGGKTNIWKDTGCVEGDLPIWQLRGQATKGKRRNQNSPFVVWIWLWGRGKFCLQNSVVLNYFLAM